MPTFVRKPVPEFGSPGRDLHGSAPADSRRNQRFSSSGEALTTLIAVLLFVLPTIARADSFTYAFTSSGGHFSFTEPSLITTTQIPFSIPPFRLEGLTFVYATVVVSGSTECFLFGTAGVTSDCSNDSASTMPSFSGFFTTFKNVNGLGTYFSDSWGCFQRNLRCVGPAAPPGWRLTISQSSAVAEPSSLVLFGSGALGILGVIRRKLRA